MGRVKGILKYGLYFFIGAWMFALGVMVGRGSSPITFDTENFQDRLQTIAREFGETEPSDQKVDLKFYDALNSPVRHEISARKQGADEIVPKREVFSPETLPGREAPGSVPVKTGKKQATMNRDAVAQAKTKTKTAMETAKAPKAKKTTPSQSKPQVSTRKDTATKTGAGQTAQQSGTGRYTIQVAAYKAFKDAVTQMAILEQKGFEAYRVKGEKNGVTWYRVRTGAFNDYKSAAAQLKKLKQAKIDGMIIKKDK